MSIRHTTSRKMADGTCYSTYRLVASERVDGKVRRRTLLNLGAHFALAREQWPLLCSRIEQLLEGKQERLALDAFPDTVETKAQRIAPQLLLEQPTLSPDTLKTNVVYFA